MFMMTRGLLFWGFGYFWIHYQTKTLDTRHLATSTWYVPWQRPDQLQLQNHLTTWGWKILRVPLLEYLHFLQLPPSSVIGSHIHRSAFLVYQVCQLLLTDQEGAEG